MIRVTRHGKVLHIETDIGSISIHDEVLRSGNPSFETRVLCYLADYLEKPRTAAPVGMPRDDAEKAISRIMGEYGFSMPSRAYAELVDELMSTPAAPGIDTSPKGGSDATAFYDASAKGFHISETCGPDGKYHAVSKFQTLADLHAFEDARRTLLIAERDRRELQATSAEVGS